MDIDQFELANRLAKYIDSEFEVQIHETGTKRKTVWYYVSRTNDKKLAKGYKNILDLIAHLTDWCQAGFGDWIKRGGFPEVKADLELAENLLEGYEYNSNSKLETVIAKGYGDVWKKFYRVIKEKDGIYTAKILNGEVQVQFDQNKGVWFEKC